MSDVTRRAALALGSAAAAGPAMAGARLNPFSPPNLKQTLMYFDEPLLNRARAVDEMDKAGVDAIVTMRPQNIYYLTTHYPQLSRMGFDETAFAILPRDERQKPRIVMAHFSYYYLASDDAVASHTDVSLFTAPSEPEVYAAMGADRFTAAEAMPAGLPQNHEAVHLSDAETARRHAAEAASQTLYASGEQALVAALRDMGLAGKTIAIDHPALARMFEAAELGGAVRDGENILRRIRLQKSPLEVELARYAARANAEAGLAAARTARAGASLSEIRAAFAVECAARNLNVNFMLVDKTVSRNVDGPLRDGQAFLIDCVAHFHQYHGDYGRTIFVGDPPNAMKKTTHAMSEVWDAVRETLKPGLKYSDIRATAAEAARRTGVDANILCNPHSVGLYHTDEPGRADRPYYEKDDLTLTEGMILSVDIPMIDVGLGGSAHLEDLMLITADGADLLNDPGDRVILV